MLEFVLHSAKIEQQEWQELESRIKGLPLEIQNQFRQKLDSQQGERGLIWLKCQRIIAEEFCPTLINGHLNPKFNNLSGIWNY
jgi:hypothetical protein